MRLQASGMPVISAGRGARGPGIDGFTPHPTKVVIMTLRNAPFLALVGVGLATMVLVTTFIGDVSGVVRGWLPAMRMLTSLLFALAGLTMTVFLYVYHKAQS
jgi:hypothetical protein